MRRSALIFLAAILLPSFGLAWLAVHSVRDQQVVLEHQQAIISQNITDALAKNVQDRMDQMRGDFVQTTQQLISASPSPQSLAQDFNRKLRDAWPMAEIGFAVDLNGEIYSPKPYEGGNSKTFRDENDRFLSNRENVEVYASKALIANQNGFSTQNAVTENSPVQQEELKKTAVDLLAKQESFQQTTSLPYRNKATSSVPAKDDGIAKSAPTPNTALQGHAELAKEADKSKLSVVGKDTLTPAADANAPLPLAPGSTASSGFVSGNGTAPAAAAPATDAAVTSRSEEKFAMADTLSATTPPPPATTATTVTTSINTPSTPATESEAKRRDFDESATVPAAPPPVSTQAQSAASSAGFYNSTAQNVSKIQRNVTPQQVLSSTTTAPLSNTLPAESDFRRVIGTEASGTLARFLENKLRLMVWAHPEASSIVFGAQLDQARLVEALKASFPVPDATLTNSSRSSATDYCLAILDDTGRPVALSQPGFQADWKHPFVATELGEVLPHWEAALYLLDPQQISRTARTLQFTLGLIVLLLIAAIVAGGSLIAADVRRQVLLAQQKTDFVSNVSHELKTPLTSIRMFADLLAEKRVPDEEKQTTYLRIIAAEAARLTRLINNVLDFARLERGAGLRPGENHRECDLVDAVLDVAETCQPHLETSGITFRHEIEAETLPITGDRDALAQIILNLVSNAEKYGGKEILVRVRRQDTPAGALGCVDVLDRGPGIPAKQVKTVFEPFHRLDDSLSSGIPGSGLGLTLARRMARAHGGDVTYSARAGGGSCFTLSIPLAHP